VSIWYENLPLCFSAIHFQGKLIRQVSCYTLIIGFRLPEPPSCCLNQFTPFVISVISIKFGILTYTYGYFRITISAYQEWSTRISSIQVPGFIREPEEHYTPLKFENWCRLR